MSREVQPPRYSFNPPGTSLLVVSADGSCRLFNVGSGRLQLDFVVRAGDATSAQACSCFCWASTLHQKQAHESTESRQLLVVGNASGQVSAYDLASGDKVWQAEDVHQGGVAGVAASGSVLYSVGADSNVCSSDIASGKLQHRFKAGKQPLTCIQAAPGAERLAVGSSGLAIWDAATQQRLYKYPGHTMPVSSLAFAVNGQYAVSSCQAERHVAVWKASGKGSKKVKPTAALLSMTEAPAHIDVATSSSNSFDVLALSVSGRICVWRCDIDKTVSTTLRATVEVQRDSAGEGLTSGQQDAILAAAFQTGSTDDILVAHGSAAKPTVEKVCLKPVGATTQSIILQPSQTGGVLLKQAKQKAAAAVVQPPTPAAAIGPDNDGNTVMLKPQLAAEGLSRKRPAEDNQAEAELAHQSDHNHQEATQLDSREPEGIEALTLEQRVNALQLQHATAPGAESADTGKLSSKAGSIAVLLSQALRSDDKQLLEKCFSMSNDKVVRSTVQQLSPQDAARLLQVSVQRLQSSPARGKQIAAWLRAVLLYHTAHLISAPGVQSSLAGLYQSIEARLALYKPLVSLQGRLDLLLAQTPSVDPLTSHLAAGPMLYHDESDELREDEVEDVMALQADDLQSVSGDSISSDDLEEASDMSEAE